MYLLHTRQPSSLHPKFWFSPNVALSDNAMSAVCLQSPVSCLVCQSSNESKSVFPQLFLAINQLILISQADSPHQTPHNKKTPQLRAQSLAHSLGVNRMNDLFARSLTSRIYDLCHEEKLADLSLAGSDGTLDTQSLTLLVAFPHLRQMARWG